MPRPAYSSRTTATTLLSVASFASTSDPLSTVSTALTSPDLCSPKKDRSKLEPMLEVYEGNSREGTEEQYQREIPMVLSPELIRGVSVKDRASRFEQQAQASSSTLRPSPRLASRTRSTSPLRLNRHRSTTPTHLRRVPVPDTAPVRRMSSITSPPDNNAGASNSVGGTSTELTRDNGRGSARRMIQQWEAQSPGAPQKPTMVRNDMPRAMSRDYLDQKPLPIPKESPTPPSLTPIRAPALPKASPSRQPFAPSPLQHLQTPTNNRKRSSTLTPSPSAYSLSPSPHGEKKKRYSSRSPLKEILTTVNAIKTKVKGRGKEKHLITQTSIAWSTDEARWTNGLDRVGTNGLPDGIVYSDRMGDQEMAASEEEDIVRTSAIMFLVPTPCSSVSPWGSWVTAWGTLTPLSLKVTYCPVQSVRRSGSSTPRRVFSGSGAQVSPIFSYNSIPLPEPGSHPDVVLSMLDCVEVRSLRREEVKGRGVPSVPEGAGTEVLEMVWSDGTKRYLGVEGVHGRLGWVSAIWDVLLACKENGTPALPPPSPQVEITHLPLSVTYNHIKGESTDAQVGSSGINLRAALTSPPPVQKVGDHWVAASVVGPTSDLSARRDINQLKDSVARLFDHGPDPTPLESSALVPSLEGSETHEWIRAWQPSIGPEVSTFSPHPSDHSHTSHIEQVKDVERENGYPRSESTLSFDPNDLNPSRSASQVRRASTVLGGEQPIRRYGAKPHMTAVEEQHVDNQSSDHRAPTHISHVTFPKPTVGGTMLVGAGRGKLPTIPSSDNSSVETGETIKTPQTTAWDAARVAESNLTSTSIPDPTVLAKLDSHTTEHDGLARQIDGVRLDLKGVITSLGPVVQEVREKTGKKELDDKLESIQLDVKGIGNALQLANLAQIRRREDFEGDTKWPELQEKLDRIVQLCEQVLAQQAVPLPALGTANVIPNGGPGLTTGEGIKDLKPVQTQRSSTFTPDSLGVSGTEEKLAGEEVANIMADVTGGSSKASPRLGPVQVLHNVSSRPGTPNDEVMKQVGEVLSVVKELKDGRVLHSQQTTDIARYLNELNTWLEGFVKNSSSELTAMNKRLHILVGPDEPPAEGQPVEPALPDLVADMHVMLTDQKRRNEAEGLVGQRLDALLGMMVEEKERQMGHQNVVENVVAVLERQRSENEMLLRALATDLTTEIRGERIRFVEAMQQATSVNVQLHVEEFKKVLSAEVHRSMQELGQLREQKRALEHQISDLFALKAKHGSGSGDNSRRNSAAPPTPTPLSPGRASRGIPSAPGR
ncbi:hypothetical protein M231_00329 [Tremella mesenterica]|uniref:Uncharacterized protein n=2 Tax=Tremella mesenterica TaxID=5217 RepID=A0A4Q1BW05_TREME|nr:hypothetical protein M231_00329 [Tremella mesenterica]